MHDNKVSEKAIWEGSITPDNDTPTFASQMQNQPQMMFCYKCNNVIPGNSKFCPYCQTALYVTCPRCGVKYSSQYPACSQCGTNRDEYLLAQRREQERREAVERENQRQRDIAERKRLQEESLKKAQEEADRKWREQQKAKERKEKEAYIAENIEIMKTEEYKATYSLLKEPVSAYGNDFGIQYGCFIQFFFHTIIIIVLVALIYFKFNLEEKFLVSMVCLPAFWGFVLMLYPEKFIKIKSFHKYIKQYNLSKRDNYDECMVSYIVNRMPIGGELNIYFLSSFIIDAYREKHNLPIKKKWSVNELWSKEFMEMVEKQS